MYRRSASKNPRKDSAGFYTYRGRKFPYGNFRTSVFCGATRCQNTECRRNCSSNTKKTEPIFSTHTIFLIKNQITTQRPHNKKFLTILKTMHCKMPQMLMVPLSSDNVHLVLTGVNNFGTFSGANTLRKMVQSATTKSITNEQTKTENRPLKLHSEGGFCLLRNRPYQPVTAPDRQAAACSA